MRTGLSTIHQTLTPEASAVLDKSISEASRRRHSQTTPLHVASTLLSSSAGPLRQACARSHPNSSHPLQCRALDLCFSVALDRLPSSPPSPPSPPPLSNALMAALKRAQAHQRRGCPEQQQQPLLAVKVELQQLIVSILDDPSVSRVMREASFSSPAVKAALEQPTSPVPPLRPLVPNPTRVLPLNPTAPARPTTAEEVGKVLDVLLRSRKRNPVLVGDSNPGVLTREVLRRIEKNEGLQGTALENARILSPAAAEFLNHDSSEIPAKIRELTQTIDTNSSEHDGGIVIDLGDLAWLVEPHHQQPQQQQQKLVPEAGRAAVAEVTAMLKLLQEKGKKAWVIGCASCATFLRCQVYHPTMESDWDLQAIPVAPRAPVPSLHPASTTASTGILSSSVESLTQARASFNAGRTSAAATAISCAKLGPPTDGMDMCRVCMAGYEKELVKLVAEQPEKTAASTLPQWLQAARANSPDWKLVNPTAPMIPGSHGSSIPFQIKAKESLWKDRADELLGRWRETCARLHPNVNVVNPPTAVAFPRLPAAPEQQISPPWSPVGTELALGRPPELAHKIRVINFRECTLDMSSAATACDTGDDTFKRVYKNLLDCVAWQPEAAASTAAALAGCKAGVLRRRRNDTWLLFAGPDKVGKRKMAAALSEVVFGDRGGKRVVSVSLAGTEEGDSEARYWGKVALDRIADAVRRSPFAVYVLEDVDRADVLVQGSIRQAAEKGRLLDSHGREVSLCSAIFVLTSSMLPKSIKALEEDGVAAYEEHRLEAAAGQRWQIELSVEASTRKRHPEWLVEERQTRQKIDHIVSDGKLSLDLNLAVGTRDEEPADSSRNSSDVTVELDRAHDRGHLPTGPQKRMLPDELVGAVEAIVFKNVDFSPLKQKVADIIRAKFEMVMGPDHAVAVEGETLDRLAAALWFGESMTAAGFEDWAERMVVPSFWQLKNRGLAEELGSVVKLVAVKDSCKPWEVGWLPDRISVVSTR